MEITRRTDYAIRMLMELAASTTGRPVSVRELAEAGEVPYSFARTVQRDLVQAGFVLTTRGPSGGLTLAKSPEEITLLDLVTAMQGEPAVSPCTREAAWCDRAAQCTVHNVWHEVDDEMRAILARKTLAGLIAANPTHC